MDDCTLYQQQLTVVDEPAATPRIDHVVQGKRAYRLLDATVTFFRRLPKPGDTIQYHIEIEKFIRQGETFLFFFNFKGRACSLDEQVEDILGEYILAAEVAAEEGLGVNAGHDLDLHNLPRFAACVPGLLEVSIGHALTVDAIRMGLTDTVGAYQRALGK